MSVVIGVSPARSTSFIRTYDSKTPGLDTADIGKKYRAVLNYEVVEKTKSFVVLKVHYIHITNTARIF